MGRGTLVGPYTRIVNAICKAAARASINSTSVASGLQRCGSGYQHCIEQLIVITVIVIRPHCMRHIDAAVVVKSVVCFFNFSIKHVLHSLFFI